jgi:acetylornithine/LysW-gamma-L-lysine aminotransferase
MAASRSRSRERSRARERTLAKKQASGPTGQQANKTPLTAAQAEELILGGTTARRGDIVITRGEGSWLFDENGKKYLDLGSAQGVAMLGHCHPGVTAAIQHQAETLTLCPSYLYNDKRAEFAKALVDVLPKYLPHLFLANSGAEAIDGALKFARLFTKRSAFVAATKGFHGRTMGALSVTWEPKYRDGFGPLLETTHVQFNDAAALDKAVTDQTAAVVLEVVQGESGVNVGTPDFLQTAQRVCRERGAVLIVDEIQTGFGRTGKWFAIEHAGIEPDIMCLAKGLGGGFPMGALAYTKQIREVLTPGSHGSTFGGSPIACAAGLAAIEAYRDEGLITRSGILGADMRNQLRGALEGVAMVRDIRGLGLMIAVELRTKVAPVLKSLMLNHGVIALPAGPTVLRLLPPLVITEKEISIGVQAIAKAIKELPA